MEKFKQRFSKTSESVKEKWLSIAAKTRIIILAVAGVVVVSAIVITAILNNPGDTEICKASGIEEATEIVTALGAAGITDVRRGPGNEIYVSKKDFEQASVVMLTNGYPRQGFDNEIWQNNVGMFSTNTQMNETRKQQLSAHIMSMLNYIPQVEKSMVTLTIPETKNYVMVGGNQDESRASIMLTLKTGQMLNKAQIKGIHELVQMAVPKLEMRNINVVDGNSVTLIATDGLDAGEELALKQQRLAVEASYIEIMIHAANGQLAPMFETIFGVDNYTISVDVKMDFSSDGEVTNEVFTPVEGLDGGIMRNIRQQYGAGGNALDGDVVGTVVNGPIAPPDYPTFPQIEAGSEFYMEWLSEINYEMNRRFEHFTNDGLRIESKSAAVVVNRPRMTEAEIDEWKEIIADAIGADTVSFLAVPFTPRPPVPQEPIYKFGDMRNILIWIIVALGVVLIVLLIMALTTSSSKKKRQIRYRGSIPVADGMGGYLRDDSFQPPPIEPEGFDLPSLLDENETKDVVLKREIKEFSKSNPEIIAQLIRTWLREDEP